MHYEADPRSVTKVASLVHSQMTSGAGTLRVQSRG